MANGHGGARSGAGRKPNSEKYPQIEAFTDQAAEDLPERYDRLKLLADGGLEQVTETWEPAGLVYAEAPLLDEEGKPKSDANGRPIVIRQLVFPELPPSELVLVRRVRSIAAPDRKANEYLVDRVAGRTVAAVEAQINHNASDELRAAFGESVTKIYGSDEEDGS